jgi:hypothetical protein
VPPTSMEAMERERRSLSRSRKAVMRSLYLLHVAASVASSWDDRESEIERTRRC